jgi:hypothetical protein
MLPNKQTPEALEKIIRKLSYHEVYVLYWKIRAKDEREIGAYFNFKIDWVHERRKSYYRKFGWKTLSNDEKRLLLLQYVKPILQKLTDGKPENLKKWPLDPPNKPVKEKKTLKERINRARVKDAIERPIEEEKPVVPEVIPPVVREKEKEEPEPIPVTIPPEPVIPPTEPIVPPTERIDPLKRLPRARPTIPNPKPKPRPRWPLYLGFLFIGLIATAVIYFLWDSLVIFPVPTFTATYTPTFTPTPTLTFSPTPSATPSPTSTVTASPTNCLGVINERVVSAPCSTFTAFPTQTIPGFIPSPTRRSNPPGNPPVSTSPFNDPSVTPVPPSGPIATRTEEPPPPNDPSPTPVF